MLFCSASSFPKGGFPWIKGELLNNYVP